MNRRTAVVTGAAGQDGSYLTERLLEEGYAVHGLVRSASRARPAPGVHLHEVDLCEHDRIAGLLVDIAPDEIYNLGGMSSVARSWSQPVLTAQINGVAALALLHHAWDLQERTGRQVRFLQASSAEIFGEPDQTPQTEATPVRPVNPYGAAKALAHHAVAVFRGHGLHANSLILYNHESPRRPDTFVTRKITRAVARIARTGEGTLALGNLDARRDWGWAPDVVDAMLRATRHTVGDDYVIATGTAHSVRDFVRAAFAHVGIDDWGRHVTVDPGLLRPVDPSLLLGDASKARTALGWRPTTTFEALVAAMVDHDLGLSGARATVE